MIKKGTTSIDGVFKGTTEIEKVYKGTSLRYKNWVTKQGVPPITLNKCRNANIKDYQIYGNSKQGELPEGYTQLEYIEATGTQYIDTGFSPDINTRVDYKVRFSQGATEASPLMGARVGSANNNRFFPIAYNNPNTEYRTTFGVTTGTVGTIDFNIDYEGSFQPQNEVSIINGTSYSLANHMFTKTDNYNMYLFATLGYEGNLYQSRGKMYYCKIYNNGTLIRDYVPCKNSSNVAGMYDMVNNTFSPSIGTGAFVAGEEMPNPTNPIEIRSVGDKTKNLWKGLNYYESNATTKALRFDLYPSAYPCIKAGNTITISATCYISQNDTRTSTRMSGQIYYVDDTYSSTYFSWYSKGQKVRANMTFTIPSDKEVRYVFVGFADYSSNSGGIWDGYIENIQIEEGSTVTEYESPGYRIPISVNPNYELPKGYIELEYIESTGTQYIDTGIVLDNASNVELEAKLTATEQSKSYYLFGDSTWTTSVSKRYMIAVSANNNNYIVDFMNNTRRINSNVSAFDGKFHVHKIENLSYYIDNELQGSGGSLSFTTAGTAYLFDARDRATSGNVGSLSWQIKKCKIYDNGTLVRNFIPAKNASGTVGMYDTVNKQFYTNAGTGTFVAGNSLTTITNIYLDEPLRKIGNADAVKLPSGYKQLEYIESTGTQYIDTGVTFSGTTSNIIARFKFSQIPQELLWFSLSGTQKSSESRWGAIQLREGVLYCTAGDKGANNGVNLGSIVANKVYTINVSTNAQSKTNYAELVGQTNGTISFDGDVYTEKNLMLFCKNSSTGQTEFISIKLYNYSVVVDNIPIRNFIPCINENNEVGMYDLVNGVFYSNQGTGTFIAGPTIYADYIDFETSKVYRKVGETIEKDNTGWQVSQASTNRFGKNLDIDIVRIPATNSQSIGHSLCNVLVNSYEPWLDSSTGVGYVLNNNRIICRFGASSSINSLQALNSFLQTTNLKLYYELATPTEESIELPDILLNKGTNIVNVETSLTPSNLWLKYKGKE